METLRERLRSAAFGAGWSLVCRLPEPVARAIFMAGAEVAWRRQGGGVQVLEGNLMRVCRTEAADSVTADAHGPDLDDTDLDDTAVDGKELRMLSRAVLRSYARYYL